MPGPFDALGTVLGGDSETSYEQGRALGAKTEEALANARRRVMENDALARGRQTLVASGVPEPQADAAYTALQAGGKIDDPIQLMLKGQEYNFRQTAGNPNTSPGDANAALRGVSNGPNEPLYKLGGGYASKFGDTDTITPLPAGAQGAEGGGTSSAMQYLRAAGAIGPDGQVRPGWEKFAWRVQNPTQKTVMVGGVPTLVTDNPWEDPGAAPPGIGAPAPGIAPPRPSMHAQPIATPEQVASNEAATAGAKATAEAQGKNLASLPTALSTIDTFSKDIDNLVASPGFDTIYGARVGTGIGQNIATFASQDAADAAALRGKVNAEAFRASINSMRGLGQLSNAEGEKVQAALTTLANPKLSPEQARVAAQQLKERLAQLKHVAQIEAGQGVAPQASAAPAAAPAAAAPIVKMIGGKKYVKTGPGPTDWAEDDGT